MTSHLTLGTPLTGPWPDGTRTISFGMGCFWGAEKKFWVVPGVVCTSVGYQGGTIANPDYKLVCTGRTGHAEVVRVAYDPDVVSLYELLKIFWENHDPTQGDRQGNDVGSQYRSAIFLGHQDDITMVSLTREAYANELAKRKFGSVTTEIAHTSGPSAPLTYWLAEDYHQQYLIKNPNGYDCHAHTGIQLPSLQQLQTPSVP